VEVTSYFNKKGFIVQIKQNRDRPLKKYRAVHPSLKIGIAGFFSLICIGMVLMMPDVTEAQQRNSMVKSVIEQIFGPHAQAALRVARCESGLNASAYNPIEVGGSHSTGVFQILYPSTWRGTSQAARSPYNFFANIIAAHDIFVHDGYSWRAWTCQP
jgi:hypothetical protein